MPYEIPDCLRSARISFTSRVADRDCETSLAKQVVDLFKCWTLRGDDFLYGCLLFCVTLFHYPTGQIVFLRGQVE